MLNVAIALVLAFLIVPSILFGNFLWPTTGGFIILVVGTYLCIRFSSARFYLRPDTSIHITLLCSYLSVAFSVWKVEELKRPLAFSLMRIFDGAVVLATMTTGIILLATGLIMLFIRAKNIR